MTDLLYRV